MSFPGEWSLSGVMKRVGKDQSLMHHRRFELPEMKEGERLLLHFGAVDWECRVLVSGHEVGRHRGGYDRFRSTSPAVIVLVPSDTVVFRPSTAITTH